VLTVHGSDSTSASPATLLLSDFFTLNRISVSFPFIVAPITPFGVPGNFSKQAAVNKTINSTYSFKHTLHFNNKTVKA